jgi:hypothetical protein
VAVNTTRRYYWLKRLWARKSCLEEDAWVAKQLGEPGTSFDPGFPFLSRLNDIGYLVVEDLNGAEDQELAGLGFSPPEIEQIQAALAAL